MAAVQKKRKPPARKPSKDSEIIVAKALENPTIGPQRLALLFKADGLHVSKNTVYRVLRAKGLQTRELRRKFLAKKNDFVGQVAITESEAANAPDKPLSTEPPSIAKKIPAAVALSVEIPAPMPAAHSPRPKDRSDPTSGTPAALMDSHLPMVRAKAENFNVIGRWTLRALNLMLAGVVVLLTIQIATSLYNALQAPLVQATLYAPAQADSEHQSIDPTPVKVSLQSYHVIKSRNLFAVKRESEIDETQELASLKKVRLAGRELGLKLIGTTVSTNQRLNQAVIESAKLRTQQIYREQERIGDVTIKRIARNNVIIATGRGDLRLSVDDENPKSSLPVTATGGTPTFVEDSTAEALKQPVAINIPKDSITKSLVDPLPLLKEMGLPPGQKQPEEGGLRLGVISPRNPLSRIGLRTGDVIRELESEEVITPTDAEALLNSLAEGGEFKATVERRGHLLNMYFSIN